LKQFRLLLSRHTDADIRNGKLDPLASVHHLRTRRATSPSFVNLEDVYVIAVDVLRRTKPPVTSDGLSIEPFPCLNWSVIASLSRAMNARHA
jgi:hypothetical protein